MISVQTAAQLIKENLTLQRRVLSSAVYADRDYPPFHRVMMDGIAVKFSSYENNQKRFPIADVQAAGQAAKSLEDELTCFEVMTGAPLPYGTDLVIPYEHLEIRDGVAFIVKEMARSMMENIHLRGSDCRKGELLLDAQSSWTGPHVGISTSMGVEPYFNHDAKILIVSTGDELVEVDEKPLDHQIRRSNVHALKVSLELNGFHQVTLSHLKDQKEAIAQHFQAATQEFDILIYSGGVSKGRFDYLPVVWEEMGVKKIFHEVAQRPGKPLWFGKDEKHQTHVVGLPGNPVSSLVCLHRYLIGGREMFVRLKTEISFDKALTYFLPVTIESSADGVLWANPLKIKNSGEFTALAQSDGFIELPAENSVFRIGESFRFYSWRGL